VIECVEAILDGLEKYDAAAPRLVVEDVAVVDDARWGRAPARIAGRTR